MVQNLLEYLFDCCKDFTAADFYPESFIEYYGLRKRVDLYVFHSDMFNNREILEMIINFKIIILFIYVVYSTTLSFFSNFPLLMFVFFANYLVASTVVNILDNLHFGLYPI